MGFDRETLKPRLIQWIGILQRFALLELPFLALWIFRRKVYTI